MSSNQSEIEIRAAYQDVLQQMIQNAVQDTVNAMAALKLSRYEFIQEVIKIEMSKQMEAKDSLKLQAIAAVGADYWLKNHAQRIEQAAKALREAQRWEATLRKIESANDFPQALSAYVQQLTDPPA